MRSIYPFRTAEAIFERNLEPDDSFSTRLKEWVGPRLAPIHISGKLLRRDDLLPFDKFLLIVPGSYDAYRDSWLAVAASTTVLNALRVAAIVKTYAGWSWLMWKAATLLIWAGIARHPGPYYFGWADIVNGPFLTRIRGWLRLPSNIKRT
jgi:hypothetical protein